MEFIRQMKKTKVPAISPIYGKEWQGSFEEINYLYAITFSLQNIDFDWLADSTISIFT